MGQAWQIDDVLNLGIKKSATPWIECESTAPRDPVSHLHMEKGVGQSTLNRQPQHYIIHTLDNSQK